MTRRRDWWQKLGWIDDDRAAHLRWERGGERGSLMDLGHHRIDENSETAVKDHIHGQLAESPAAMVSVQLDDVLGVEEAQNLPGTIDEHPNWRRRCPVDASTFATDPRIVRVGQLMGENGRNHNSLTPQEELAT
jgi:4-alpha-glucanotransferase